MAGPVKLKADGDNLSNAFEGVQEFSTTEIKEGVITNIITTEFAGTTGVGSLQVTTTGAPANFTSIGTFTDTVASQAVGTHPWDGGFNTVNTYTFSQGTATATDSKTARPLRTSGVEGELLESTDTQIDSEVLDNVLTAMIEQADNTAGQYYLSASAPSGGTWTSRGTITDTQVDGTGTTTKTLWQKTAATTVPSSTTNRSLVKEDNGLQEFTTAELQSLVGRFRNRIAATNLGTYAVATAAPGTGTWQQMGETLTDQRKTSASYNYSGSYTGSYSGTYTGYYTGFFTGTYVGSFQRFFGGFLNGTFNSNFSGTYSQAFTGFYTGSYSGTYTGTYAGVTVLATSATQESKKLFMRIA